MTVQGVVDYCPESLQGLPAHLFLTMINALMMSKCKISTKSSYPEDYGKHLTNGDEFDFIVVGSGSAGSVLANVLSENPKWKVLVLEAGTYPSSLSEIPSLLFNLQGTDEDWGYESEPCVNACLGLKNGKSLWPRGKTLGGCSTINVMLYMRGNRRDYDEWADLGNPGWDYDSIVEFFHKSENVINEKYKEYGHNPSGQVLSKYDSNEPIADLIKRVATDLGYPPIEHEGKLGYFEALQIISNGTRFNSAKAFLGNVKDRPNLKVSLNSMVEKVQIVNNKATGVIVRVNGEKLLVKASKEVILAAGAVNTPQLLMLSGIGPKNHLKEMGITQIADLNVGGNLQDHLFFLGYFLTVPPHLVHKIDPLDEIYKYFMHQSGAFAQIGITNLIGFINTRNQSDLYPNLQMYHVIHQQNDHFLLPELLKTNGLKDDLVRLKLEANGKSPTAHLIPGLLKPKSQGTVKLRSSDPGDKPVIDPNYLQDDDDVETLLEGIEYLEKMIRSPQFIDNGIELVNLRLDRCDGFQYRSRDYWKCAIRYLSNTIYHPVGTAKMGPKSDRQAVVDQRLRVHGIEGLRVIDCSIMPSITSGNTHAPATMIGRKGGTMITEDWIDYDAIKIEL